MRWTFPAVFSAAMLQACTHQPPLLAHSPTVGDAIARNTAMQLVDPWPEPSGQTDFPVPAQREAKRPEQPAGLFLTRTPPGGE